MKVDYAAEQEFSPGAAREAVPTHDRLPDRAAADGMRAARARVLDALREKVA